MITLRLDTSEYQTPTLSLDLGIGYMMILGQDLKDISQ